MRRSVTISARILCAFTGVCLLAVMVFVLFLMVAQYHPAPVEYLDLKGKKGQSIRNQDEFTLMSWNIGYAGLGKEMDFFYEGGKLVKPESDEFMKYLHGILLTVKTHDTADFIFIQEADIHSKRSYYTDESGELAGILKDHCFAFAKNSQLSEIIQNSNSSITENLDKFFRKILITIRQVVY